MPGQEITATLSTVSDFSNIVAIDYPENARIYLLTNIDTPFEFQYDEDRKLYFIPKNVHTPRSSWQYEIRAYLKDAPEVELFSDTKFTSSPRLQNSPKTNSPTYTTQEELRVQLGLKSFSKNPFIRFSAYYKTNEGGKLSDLKPLEFIENREDALAFYNNEYLQGIYANIDRVDYEDFSMIFKFSEEDLNAEIHNHIYIKSESISEPLYRYDVAKSKYLGAINGGNSDPIVSYTNIKNGLGLFGSSTGVVDSIQIK